MTDSKGDKVFERMLCWTEISNVLFYGIYSWDTELSTYALISPVANIACPTYLCESFYIVHPDEFISVDADDVEGFYRYINNKK